MILFEINCDFQNQSLEYYFNSFVLFSNKNNQLFNKDRFLDDSNDYDVDKEKNCLMQTLAFYYSFFLIQIKIKRYGA